MAEVLLSPGVLARENDQSFISGQPVQAGAAIVGPTVKGPVGIPTVVGSYSEYQRTFGAIVESGSAEYTYFTSISAYNYFQQGGDSLLVTRVVSGSYTSATSTAIQNDVESGTLEDLNSATKNTFNITGSTGGTFVASASAGGNVTASFAMTAGVSGSIGTISSLTASGTFAIGDVLTFTSESLGADQADGKDLTLTLVDASITNQTAFVLETLSEGVIANSGTATGANGTLVNGTKDNIRWEIASPNTASGTFNLLIRRGDDTSTSKTILETWTNLSLDPNSSNYIEKVIGNSKQTVTQDVGTGEYYVANAGTYNTLSNFVRVKSVAAKTLNYFDNNGNAKSQYTASIPLAGEGSFVDAVGTPFVGVGANFYENINDTVVGANTQGLVADNYSISLQLLANRDAYRYNLITVPGLYNSGYAGPISTMINNSSFRGDNIAVIDLVPYASGINTVTSQAGGRDTSYAAAYWPWLQTIDPDLGSLVWVPASAMIPGVYAFNDRAGEAWFAPAGLNRGGLPVVRTEFKLNQAVRDKLYDNKVNPIATFPRVGPVAYGQKTLQKKASALDRINVRRLLISLKNFIGDTSKNLVFEQNTTVTRNRFLNAVTPFLESVQQRQGLFAFRVVMDESNNTAEAIDRNQLVGQIFIQPTKTAEFIVLDYTIQPTGATFND